MSFHRNLAKVKLLLWKFLFWSVAESLPRPLRSRKPWTNRRKRQWSKPRRPRQTLNSHQQARILHPQSLDSKDRFSQNFSQNWATRLCQFQQIQLGSICVPFSSVDSELLCMKACIHVHRSIDVALIIHVHGNDTRHEEDRTRREKRIGRAYLSFQPYRNIGAAITRRLWMPTSLHK